MKVEQRIESLGYVLPPPPSAVAVYRPALTVGNQCFTSGHLPITADGGMMTGRVGQDVDQEQGFLAARQAGLAMLATLRQHLGDLDRVERVVKLLGMVWCPSDFTAQPAVINGCSELMKDVFGEDTGVGTRSAVGVASLPMGVSVEIEGIFLIKP